MKGFEKKIVISAVNINEGGPLSILKDCLKAFERIQKVQNLNIIVLVHDTELVKEYKDLFTIIEYSLIKSSWLRRIYFEYVQCRRISKKITPDLWISLHDITPNVSCKQVVYCHNPALFHKLRFNDLVFDKTFFLFCIFYRFLYRIGIHKNAYVIVQQTWVAEIFERIYKVKPLIAHPSIEDINLNNLPKRTVEARRKFSFFYPALPRVAKNFEVLLEAVKIVAALRADFEVILSISGNENKYAKFLYANYKVDPIIKFRGARTRLEIFEIYNCVDCLVFPSKLETWGLPISEFKMFDKPMLLADKTYAHETLADFKKAKFFNCDDPVELANYMQLLMDNELRFDVNSAMTSDRPFFENWCQLVTFLSQTC